MVTIPFFRNFTLQFKTFLGYFEKTNKPGNKQRSWVLRSAFYLLYEGENKNAFQSVLHSLILKALTCNNYYFRLSTIPKLKTALF